MITTLQIDASYVDYWGSYNAAVLARMGDKVERSGCFLPRFAIVPGQGLQTIPSSGRISYNFRLEPGSMIWGVLPYNQAGLFNLTDLCLGMSLFQDPLAGAAMFTTGADDSSQTSFTLLPAWWPVLGDGVFTLDAWGNPGDLAYFILGVAELPKC